MIWKRVLLVSILFLLLTVGLLYYVFPNVLNPLRIDSVPTGAYIVPWMQPSVSFEQLDFEILANGTFDIDAAMANALKLSITFRIKMWDNTTRVIPSTVYLGHDSQYMYIGGKFVGMHSNPASEPNVYAEPNNFFVFFDTGNTGVLKTPESGSSAGVTIAMPSDTLWGCQYHDMLWVYEPTQYKHMVWMPADNYITNKALNFSVRDEACGYESSTGTVKILFSRFLRIDNAYMNAFQMRPGERWVMGFLLELEFQKGRDNRVDGWPQKTFEVWSDDSSWWPKLVIDLTNPPKTIPGQATSGRQT